MTTQEFRTLGTMALQSTWLGRRLGLVIGNDSGALASRIGAVIGGVITRTVPLPK